MLTEGARRSSTPLGVETQRRLLKSIPVAERAAIKLGRKEPEKAGVKLLDQIIARSDEDTGIIEVIMQGSNNRECADVANKYAEAFEEISRELMEKSAEDTLQYIKEQMDNAERVLSSKEKAIFEFNTQHGIVLLDQEVISRNDRISSLELEKMQLGIDLKQLEIKLDNLQNTFRDQTIKLAQDPQLLNRNTHNKVEYMETSIIDLEVKRASLMEKYKARHPLVRQIDQQLKELRKQSEQEISDVINNKLVNQDGYLKERDTIVEMNVQIVLDKSKITQLANIIDRLKQEQLKYPELQYEYNRLLREKEVAEELFLMLYQQHQQAMIEKVQRDVKVKIFEKAIVPQNPFKPNRKKNIIIAVALGLLLGLGLAFLLEEMEETIHSSDDVKNYLNLPVLGSIPYSAETINKLITDVPLKSPIAEAYRRLSFFTQLFCLDPPIKTLLVTSSKSDEGKSTTLANLAISMAQEGTKVLIIDTDLRRPMLHRMFGVDNSLGISSILTGELEAEIAVSDLSVSGRLPKESFMEVVVDRLIQPSTIKGLSIIPSGPLPANSIELLRSERMLAFLRCIEKKADIIMFDSPPSIHVIDAVVLSQILDGVLFVINSGRINRDEALQVKYMIESTKTPIIGVALNNIEASSPDYYYYYYYGGYGYGSRQRRKRVKLKR